MTTCGTYVRAKSPLGKWWSAPIEELTEESFRVFVCRVLNKHGLVVVLSAQMDAAVLATKGEPPEETR